MTQIKRYVGLDVDKDTIEIAVGEGGRLPAWAKQRLSQPRFGGAGARAPEPSLAKKLELTQSQKLDSMRTSSSHLSRITT